MRIIKRGELFQDKLYQVTCHTCETVFEFKCSEAKVEYTDRPNDSPCFVIPCPPVR